MIIHKEGFKIIGITAVLIFLLLILIYHYLPALMIYVIILSVIMLGLVLQFFRNPKRTIKSLNDNIIYAPADGKVVVIEETNESEYFKEKKLQVSIFMSPLNVHVNRNPFGGVVKYLKYHPGKYLVAWHPKSSTENERTTVVLDNGKAEILLRQIAGMVAKRIINYLNEGQKVTQGSEMGFIKFGSRVDIFIPLDADLQVGIGDKVKGNKSIIAVLK